jgi:hypothetical protein
MGSVIDYIECPKCKSEDCHSDFYYKTGEEYLSCGECGYRRYFTIKEDSRDKKLNEMTQSDFELNELVNPWGAYRLKEIGNIGFTCGALESKEQYEELLKNVMENIDFVDEFTLSRYVNEKIVKLRVVETAKVINEMVVGD